jgi:hypothetical protein
VRKPDGDMTIYKITNMVLNKDIRHLAIGYRFKLIFKKPLQQNKHKDRTLFGIAILAEIVLSELTCCRYP